jgi:pimeloyl-ACP methyl ester carboxylesterase
MNYAASRHPAILGRDRLVASRSASDRTNRSRWRSVAKRLAEVAESSPTVLQSERRSAIPDLVITFCLLHGQWHDGLCWEPVGVLLRARGRGVIAPDMPFDDPRADYADRARPALEALDGVDGPVVVVGHSIASAEAALVAAACEPALLVHLCPRFGGFPTPPDAPSIFRPGFPFPARDTHGRSVWTESDAIKTMYPRLPPEAARELASRLRPGASAVGDYPLSQPPNVRTALVYTIEDEFFTPEWERYVARELLGVEPIELPGGHFPMVEHPDALAELLDRLASDATGANSVAREI